MGPWPGSCLWSEERGLSGCLDFLLSCPVLGPLSGLLMLRGAVFAPGPVRYRGVRAVLADAQFLGLVPPCLDYAAM